MEGTLALNAASGLSLPATFGALQNAAFAVCSGAIALKPQYRPRSGSRYGVRGKLETWRRRLHDVLQ
jgi:hypothetical protein